MKVCHVGTAHRRYDTRIFYKECQSLAKAGYDVTFLIADDGKPEEIRNGVKILPVHGAPRARLLERFLKYNKIMLQKALELNADLYHLHEWELLPWAKELKRRNKIVVFDSHEYYSLQIKDHYGFDLKSSLALRLYYYCEGLIGDYVDALIFPCNRDGVHPFEGKCKKLITLDNFPKLDMFHCYNPKAKKLDRSICYVGGLSEERGITEVIKAASLSNANVYLAGNYSTSAYRKKTEGLKEYNTATYLGLLERKNVIKLLQQCQIGMATIYNVGQYNKFDNLPTKCFEYMSLGLPVILTKAKYNEQVNKEYNFGICVDPKNVNEIAEAIQYLLEQPSVAREMGENGREAVYKIFNWEIEQKKLLALYKELGV